MSHAMAMNHDCCSRARARCSTPPTSKPSRQGVSTPGFQCPKLLRHLTNKIPRLRSRHIVPERRAVLCSPCRVARANLFIRTSAGLQSTPDEGVMILRLEKTPAGLDLGSPLPPDSDLDSVVMKPVVRAWVAFCVAPREPAVVSWRTISSPARTLSRLRPIAATSRRATQQLNTSPPDDHLYLGPVGEQTPASNGPRAPCGPVPDDRLEPGGQRVGSSSASSGSPSSMAERAPSPRRWCW